MESIASTVGVLRGLAGMLLSGSLTLCVGFADGDRPPAISLGGSRWAVGVAPVGDGQDCYDPCLVIDGVQGAVIATAGR
jgi:hypothetical protein